jgi:hypothetical protein
MRSGLNFKIILLGGLLAFSLISLKVNSDSIGVPNDYQFWTDIEDFYYNPPHTDTGSPAPHCGMKYFRYKNDIQDWYIKTQRKLRASQYYSSDKKKYIRWQRNRLLSEYDSRRELIAND